MLLTSFDVWIRQHARGRTYFTIPKLSEERLRQAPEPGSLYHRAYHDMDLEASNSIRCSEMTMQQKFAFDLESFQNFIATQRMHVRTNAATTGGQIYSPALDYLRALLGMHLEVHPGASIPNDLLSGPYESEDDGSIAIGQEKAQRLFWLVRGGACLQEDQTWEATRDGFKAILHLIKGTTEAGTLTQEGERRLMLATQLFFLFCLLGVFASQWPKCAFFSLHTVRCKTLTTIATDVLQTNLGNVTSLISTIGNHSKQQFELGEIASTLRVQGRVNLRLERYGSQLQHYGSRWQLRVMQCVHSPHRELQLAIYRNLCASRADLFLRAPNIDGSQIPSSAPESQHTDAGNTTGLMHEPWSDFGIE